MSTTNQIAVEAADAIFNKPDFEPIRNKILTRKEFRLLATPLIQAAIEEATEELHKKALYWQDKALGIESRAATAGEPRACGFCGLPHDPEHSDCHGERAAPRGEQVAERSSVAKPWTYVEDNGYWEIFAGRKSIGIAISEASARSIVAEGNASLVQLPVSAAQYYRDALPLESKDGVVYLNQGRGSFNIVLSQRPGSAAQGWTILKEIENWILNNCQESPGRAYILKIIEDEMKRKPRRTRQA